eukprot:84784-Ditylum_brightwellii.AAC.1
MKKHWQQQHHQQQQQKVVQKNVPHVTHLGNPLNINAYTELFSCKILWWFDAMGCNSSPCTDDKDGDMEVND